MLSLFGLLTAGASRMPFCPFLMRPVSRTPVRQPVFVCGPLSRVLNIRNPECLPSRSRAPDIGRARHDDPARKIFLCVEYKSHISSIRPCLDREGRLPSLLIESLVIVIGQPPGSPRVGNIKMCFLAFEGRTKNDVPRVAMDLGP
jgi:hypothetical protein